MKVYVSSTYQDLRAHRAAVDRVLRQMGHDPVGMEQYVAEGTTPLTKVRDDVRSCDVYLVIVGWRYGYQPKVDNPDELSITELEYRQALESGRTILAFLLDPDEPWTPSQMDALSPEGDARIRAFRAELGAGYLAGIFRTPDQLAGLVAATVARQGINQRMLDRRLSMEVVSDMMLQFAAGNASAIPSIRTMVGDASAGTVRALRIDLDAAHPWWCTRLFLLAAMVSALTEVRQIVFAGPDGSFAGMATPSAVRESLAAAIPELAAVDAQFREELGSPDVDREVTRMLGIWAQAIQPSEPQVHVVLRRPLLSRWLGDRLVTRCIEVDPVVGLTLIQAQQIVDSLLPDVPLERLPDPAPAAARSELMVVSRDAFALDLARQWVRTSLPRMPVR